MSLFMAGGRLASLEKEGDLSDSGLSWPSSFPLPLLDKTGHPWDPLVFRDMTLCFQSVGLSPQEHIGKDVLAHGPRNTALSAGLGVGGCGNETYTRAELCPWAVSQVKPFLPSRDGN